MIRLGSKAILSTLLVMAFSLYHSSFASAQEECPVIPTDGPGVERIEGQGSYSFYGMSLLVDQPVVALVDGTYTVLGLENQFASSDGQVIGRITSDFSTSPFSYAINLPAVPTGLSLDVDQDDQEESGPQIFYVILGQNILNTPFLEQISQGGVLMSTVVDGETREILEGALVLYAPDDEQGFPCNAGEDGVFFTEDDLIATLPAGYTIARFDGDEVTFDRSQVATVDIVEEASLETPDFSDQGIVESYESLIDFLRERYVFNNFYDFDWDAIYAEFLPQVQQAQEENNLGQYYVALYRLTQSIGDGHVYVEPGEALTTPEAIAANSDFLAYIHGGIGASAVELDDGRIVIVSTVPDGPAEELGLTFGTEIVSLYGLPIEEAIEASQYPYYPGSDASKRYRQVQTLLRVVPGTEVEIGYILPGSTEVMTATRTAITLPRAQPEDYDLMPMEYKLVDNFGYVTWPAFERTGIANHIYADFIKMMNENHIPGIIMDLRGNGGGSSQLEAAALSYLYSEDAPFNYEGTSRVEYNSATGEWVTKFDELTLSAPAGSDPYEGEVVYLVDVDCASACEFLGYALQRTGRATVIAQYPSVGAGGSTNAVILPGGIKVNYTASTEIDDATGMPTFQFVGVVPDIKVPVTEETEQAELDGKDPVLEVALAYLHSQELAELDAVPATYAEGTISTMVPANWHADSSNLKYTSPDEKTGMIFAQYTHTDATEPDAIAAAISDQAEKFGEHESEAGTWSLYEMPFGTQFVTLAVITIDNTPYVGVMVADDEAMLAALTVNVLYPALDAFTVVEE